MRDLVTLALGIIGTVLGCINTFLLFDRRRVRLRVVPKSAVREPGGVWSSATQHISGETACIEVINMSSFPVTVADVGYTLPSKRRVSITEPIVFDSKGWPRRLEARESVTVYVSVADLPRNIGKAFATTDCGVTRLGNSPTLDYLRRH